mgnify:CR=1 FL=1
MATGGSLAITTAALNPEAACGFVVALTHQDAWVRAAEERVARLRDEVESDLRTGWSSYEHRGMSTWEQIKDAVRDGWDRVMGRHPVGTR